MKGQVTILALIVIFATLVMFSVLQPELSTFVTSTSNSLGGVGGELIKLLPAFAVITIILLPVFLILNR